jgi:hypothetical protein
VQVSETAVNAAFSGVYNQDSCAREDKGESGWGCLRDDDGNPSLTRDCSRFRSLDIVMQLPLSMPVRPRYDKAFSAEIVRFINEGRFDRSRSRHMDLFYTQNQCGLGNAKSAANEYQLDVDGMMGTILFAMFFQVGFQGSGFRGVRL